MIEGAYNQIVHWKSNLFKVPSGSMGKKFVAELSRLFEAYTTESGLESIALTAAMTLPALMLQKPHAKSKVQEHTACLKRRMSLWEKGDIDELIKEGRAIQRSLLSSRPPKNVGDDAKVARKFSKLMMEGKVRAALQLLNNETRSAPLMLDDVVEECGKSVRDILKEKHPHPKPPHPDVILSNDSTTANNDFHPIVFDSITAESIRKSTLLTEGSAGPSGMDALCWRRLCTAFGEKSNQLCSAIATFAKRICNSYVDPTCLRAYTSCRLVPLDKCPGVRPVGVGEVVHRIVGKAVMKVVKQDLQEAIGSIQLCAGQDAGCEAAVHAMEHLFAGEDTEAMLLVDATNAFNQLNRQVTLLNTDKICPAMAHVLINTYRCCSHLYVDGQCLLSEEGTTQGDPLAMAMYAIGTLPLIRKLDGIAKQTWFADDSAAASSLKRLKSWWDLLNEIGPLYGYFPNGAKTHMLVKPQHVAKAREIFKDTAIMISEEGERYLGGAIGTISFIQQYVQTKVDGWIKDIQKLSEFATTQPQAAYAALTHGLISRWNYLLRVIDWERLSSDELLQPLKAAIQSQFIPAITGQAPPGQQVREILALPVRLGGLGLQNPITMAKEQQSASQQICSPLVDRIVHQQHHMGDCHLAQQEIKANISSCKRTQRKEEAKNLENQLPFNLQRSMELAQEKGASAWLTSLPIDEHGFAMHKSAFRDALSLRYGWSLKNPPSHCTCGHPFSVDHALTCKTGGFPAIRHNEVRDITASLLSEVCHGVTIEPHLQPLTGEVMQHKSAITDEGARLDVAMYGFWGGRFEKAFADVRAFNPCAQSNCRSPLATVYRRHEQEKRRHYEERVREVEHATFTPLVLSVTGGMGRAATTFYSRLASMISEKRSTQYSNTLNWIRCKLSFALLRASIMSIRGTRSSRNHQPSEANHVQGPIDLQLMEGHIY